MTDDYLKTRNYHVTTTLSKEEVQRIFDLAIERMNYLGNGYET
jgi:hypothetical protein